MKKLILAYSFWTGDDIGMLQKSIEYHKNHVDKIIVCYQDISNRGERNIVNHEYLFNNPDFELINYEPDLSINTKANELRKHNDMLGFAKNLGASHFVIAAADHFYRPELWELGKEIMKDESIDLIVTQMKTHYKHPEWILSPIEDYYMPFIHRVKINTAFVNSKAYPVVADPSVKVNTFQNVYIMPPEEGLMNHLSMIRVDISKKFRNAASSIRWTRSQIEQFEREYERAAIGDRISYFQNRKLILNSDLFDF
jgi:hypothetical protein